MGFSYDFSNGKSDVIYRPDTKQVLDEQSWKEIIKSPDRPGVLPIRMQEEGNTICFYYDISQATNMRAWMSEASQKKQMEMKEKISRMKQTLIASGIPEKEIMSEQKYMYVDDRTEEVQFICIPLKKPRKDEKKNNSGLSEKKLNSIKEDLNMDLPPIPPEPSDDCFIEELTGSQEKSKKGFRNHSKEIPEEKNAFGKMTFNEISEPVLDNSDLYEEMSDRSSEDNEKTGIERAFHSEKVNKNEEEEEKEEEDGTVLLADEGNEGTVLLNILPRVNAKLIRLRTQETFQIEKRECKIGKKSSAVDICIRNNPTISREHCTIYFIDGDYFLEDNGSSNFTYCNDKRVMPGEKVKLSNDCKIQLSDESFVFKKEE
ncbi:MAG: FHA domain-containing protein [Blautia sp.]|nr:FHA domain-containing protein [Lachnospiraceae bacterium]MDY4693317.1 FHA domain-containing protein [Blautia sp.]